MHLLLLTSTHHRTHAHTEGCDWGRQRGRCRCLRSRRIPGCWRQHQLRSSVLAHSWICCHHQRTTVFHALGVPGVSWDGHRCGEHDLVPRGRVGTWGGHKLRVSGGDHGLWCMEDWLPSCELIVATDKIVDRWLIICFFHMRGLQVATTFGGSIYQGH